MPLTNQSSPDPEEVNAERQVSQEEDAPAVPMERETAPSETNKEVAASANDDTAPAESQGKARDAPTTDGGGFAAIEARLDAIRDVLESRLRTDETKDRMFDAMYEELQGHRSEASLRCLKRLLLSLVGMHDNLTHLLRSAKGETEEALRIALDDLLGVLYPEEVTPLEPEPGSAFDPKAHRAIKRIPTANEAEDRTVCEVLRAGFFWGAKIVSSQ